MGSRLLPQSLHELYAHALILERDASIRFEALARCMRDAGMERLAVEFDQIGKEEREQYELLAAGTEGRGLPQIQPWEYAWHFLGPAGDVIAAPSTARDVLALALSAERRAQSFYADVAEHVEDDAVSALAADMAADETRHVQRLEHLLERESEQATPEDDAARAVPLS